MQYDRNQTIDIEIIIGYMRKVGIIDFEGMTSNGHWVVKLESAKKS